VEQLQLDELYAVLRDLNAGEISEDEAMERLERSPYWVWTAMDPDSKLLLVIDVGTRTLAMAQRVVHQLVQVLAPGCVPLFLTDGFKEYGTAILAHFGHWIQPERRQDKGPMPKPRWVPLPELLYAQVVKSYRRCRIVGVTYRVVFGTMERVQQEPTNGRGSAKLWRPYTPAMAAGLTDRVWTLKEVLLYRVPPWPQAQTI
jgi:hypothetical protein